MTRRSNGASAAAAVLAAWAAPAVAQTLPLAPLPQQPIVATPLPPLDGQDAVPEAPAPGGAAAPRSPVVAAFPNAWQPRASATLIALDKVNARSASIVVPVGRSAKFQTLTIEVKTCVVRPPDQPQDAAAGVAVSDSRGAEFGFRGWLIRSAPSASMMAHPIYDLRVAGCGA